MIYGETKSEEAGAAHFQKSTTASNYLNHPRIIYLCEIYGCLLRLEWNS